MRDNLASRITTFKLCFWHSMGVVSYELGEAQNIHCMLWYFQSLFKSQTLYHLNYLVSWFCYEKLLTLSWIITQLLYVFAFDSRACLLSGVKKFKSCLVFHDLGFLAHSFRQAQETHYTYINFWTYSIH